MLVEALVAHPTLEAFRKGVLGRFARLDVAPVELVCLGPSSRTTRLPESEEPGTAARHSLVTSSMIVSTRKRRP
jgi:hypothetical protein